MQCNKGEKCMKFDELLNQYIEQLGCTAKEIAVVTGLSPASLSRYRTGERMPNAQHLHQITQGIVRLAKEKGMDHINRETVETASKFIDDMGYSFPVLFDRDMDAASVYGVYSIPSTYFIAADGTAVARASGAIDADTLQKGIDMINTQS